MHRLKVAPLTIAGVLLFALPGMASGATTIGATGGNGGTACTQEFTWVQDATASTSPSYAVPTGGVITRWSHAVSAATPDTATMRLKIFRKTAPQMYLTVGHSAFEPLGSECLKNFATQISVQAGDLLGLRTGPALTDCFRTAQAGDVTENNFGPDPPVGGTFNSDNTFDGYLLNLSVLVEPDADGDGFGDETQDGCPGDALNHGDCVSPETTITKDAPKTTDKHKVKFKFVSDDPTATFECKLDKKPYKPCTSPRKVKVDEGKHKFRVRAIDAAGNVDPTPDKDKFKVVE